jgi:hypothetical protein
VACKGTDKDILGNVQLNVRTNVPFYLKYFAYRQTAPDTETSTAQVQTLDDGCGDRGTERAPGFQPCCFDPHNISVIHSRQSPDAYHTSVALSLH